ncbi:MAG: hypothetical protein HYZ11_04685 [Candidatus Tectomicrobia bacterium]|uniref:Uncharacterized protein n=1 Tax=Tectimicrobiota bacterium TaxID=2528274 RepID=A0A932MP76_UNCTE|nr:hypothetical protein [Candidatus Tectomicrobia bacterium]
MSGDLAQRWMEGICEELGGRLSPELGLLSQDSGTPVEGVAQGTEPSDGDRVRENSS